MADLITTRPTVAEIDSHALAAHFPELGRVAGGPARLLPVVKSDAYGHGLARAARTLRDAGAQRFAVATTDEGEALRAAGFAEPIIVLGGVYPADYVRIAETGLTSVIWDAQTGAELAAAGRRVGRATAVHVKVDTGMTRLGVQPGEAAALLAALRTISGLSVDGLLTHFCNAESAAGAETTRQLETFQQLVGELTSAGLRPPVVHAANSAATLMIPASHFDLVRPGIALYGCYPVPAAHSRATLRPAMRLVTRIIALRTISAGTSVGYGATWVAARASRLATLPIGYADGYPRALSNVGQVVIRGSRAPIAGRVCMDHLMVDVTETPNVTLGDEVELWGPALPVEEVAALAETISYELVTRVGPRVPRRWI